MIKAPITRRSALRTLGGLMALTLPLSCQSKRNGPKDWVDEGIKFHNQEKIDQAEHCFDQALKLDSEYGPAWVGKGMVFYSRNKIAKALECVGKGVHYHPEYYEGWLLQGVLRLELKQYDRAVASFNEVLKIKPGQKNAQKLKCAILRKQNNDPVTYVRQCLQDPPEKAEDVSEQEKLNRRLFGLPIQIWESTKRGRELREQMRDAGAKF